MSRKLVVYALAGIVLLAAAAYGGYWVAGMRSMMSMPGESGASMAAAPEAMQSQRKVLYWHDPMYPQHKFDKPGQSPFMDMALEPVYADEAGGSSVRIDPALSQSLGMRTALVESGSFSRRVDTVGTVQADERRINVLQSRAAGWLEKLHVRAVDDPVERGMPLAEIYAPELLAAQEEFLLLLASEGERSEIARAARERLLLLGLTEKQVAAVQATKKTQRRVVLHAPSSGIVTELGAREGAQVSPGMPVAKIVDLSRIWIVAEVPEMQLASIATGNPTEARLGAMPGQVFEGKVEYIYPGVDSTTRTVRVRFSVRNKNLALRPGMVANVSVFGGSRHQALMVPAEAVIHTGSRSVVVVEEAAGRFRVQEVAIGRDNGDRTEITQGLSAGERIVISGQFLIDSEANLRGTISRLEPMPTQTGAKSESQDKDRASAGDHVAEGMVKSVDMEAGKVVISHGPVESLDWPSMTMGFTVADKALLGALKPDQRIEFHFIEAGGDYQVTDATLKADQAKPSGAAK